MEFTKENNQLKIVETREITRKFSLDSLLSRRASLGRQKDRIEAGIAEVDLLIEKAREVNVKTEDEVRVAVAQAAQAEEVSVSQV